MQVWRISNHVDLSGRGGELSDGRWNRVGTPVVYCSDHPATALLEMLARIGRWDVPSAFRLLTIDVPDDAPHLRIEPPLLSASWRTEIDATRELGTQILKSTEHLFLIVPCVLVPLASNVLLNPAHPDVRRCAITAVTDEPFDPRLIR